MANTDFSLKHDAVGPETFGGLMVPADGTSSGDVLTATGTPGEPAVWQPAGGGSQPVTRAQYRSDADTTIATSASHSLPWDSKVLGDDLLDLSDPAAPFVIAAGVYAVTAIPTHFAAITANGSVKAQLDLDNDGDDFSVIETAYHSTVAPKFAVKGTYYIPAGGVIVVTVQNLDGTNSLDFGLFAYVQRLSGPE